MLNALESSVIDAPFAAASASTDVYAMPATQGQVRFWSLDQLDPGNPALNMPLMWQCTGDLDVAAVGAAFQQCVDRHESLRTTFAWANDKLAQVIHPRMELTTPLADVSHLSGEAQRVEADWITRAHAAFRFDLNRGPLLEVRVLKYGPKHHVLLVTMHHIICDGISNGILMRDMISFYETLVEGATTLELPQLPVQFGDYAVWHEEWRASDDAEASLQFWRDALGSDFTPVRLPHDADAIQLPTEAKTGDIETLLVPRELTSRAHAFCVRENVTFNMLLFSVFSALISRLTQQKDLTIGSPCANRTEDTADLIGLFMNIQVLRVRLESGSTFRDVLQQVQAWTLGAYENQALPFEELVHDSHFAEGARAFQIPVFFLYQKSFMLTRRIGNLEIVPLRSESPGAVFEMMFAIVDREEEGPRLQLEYNPTQFKPATIQRYLRMYLNLLDSAISAPETRVEELSFMSASERSALLARGGAAATDFGAFQALHKHFLQRASTTPHALAATCNGTTWSYAQLENYSTNLARRLVHEGLQPGDLVAVCIDRSLEMLGAVLAIMMAGGAYVPLDPRHPRDRLEMVLADSGVALILTGLHLDVTTTAKCLDIRDPQPRFDHVMLPQDCAADSLAYVIYTSGSTGVPKGVAIEHASLMNLLQSMRREPGLNSDDTLVAITTLAFDIAALELLLPLLTGAKLVIATDEEVVQPKKLLGLLKESRATVLQATPGAWRTLIDEGWSASLPLKVLCGGETLSRVLADKMLERSSEVWNVYGPTETTIWSSATRVMSGTGPLRLGMPIANTKFYVLDECRQPVPVGVAGELFIGGDGLARGYWNRPELTAKKFIANPFGPGRIYSTGDLARWHGDTTVELLGRADFQVKVRGYRIELGEIEGALLKHPQVRDAVVVQHVIQDAPGVEGITRLIAYVDAGKHAEAADNAGLVAELEAQLGRSLPEYMMPNVIVALKEMPRNTNGKVDRNALPDVFAQAGNRGLKHPEEKADDFLGPRDVIERQLTEIWQTSLGISRISIRASFFSLGVGSLAALRLITKMNRVYATDLGLASLISASTIESLADLIRKKFSPNTTSALVPIQPYGTRPPLFIVHGVGGNVVSFYGLAKRMGQNQPVYGIQAQSLLSRRSALVDLRDMAAHYLADIRKVQPHGPYNFLGYSFGGTVVLEMAQQLRAAGEDVAVLGMLDSKAKTYMDRLIASRTVSSKVTRRLQRFHGNTKYMDWSNRIQYVREKAWTRTIRLTYRLAALLRIAKVPSFLKSAYDINYVALENYTAQRYDGRLTLFRVTDQDDPNAPRELGWNDIFQRGVDVHDLPGDHERIFLEPNIDALANGLRTCLQGV